MITKIIPYTDLDGNEQKEVAYFNLTEFEFYRLTAAMPGGAEKYLKKILDEQDLPKLFETFEMLVQTAYGHKSDDGKRFVKDKASLDAFMQTEAYSNLCMSLMFDAQAGSEFIRGILPTKLSSQIPEDAQLPAAVEAMG